jgi:hypothetical protein
MPPIVATIATVIASAVTAGTSIYQAQDYKGPDTNQAALDAKSQSDQNAKNAANNAASLEAQKTALIRRAAPDAQAATGGALAPDAFASFTSMLAGMPGDNALAQRILNGGAASPTGTQTSSGFTPPSSTSSPTMPAMGSSGDGSQSPVPSGDGQGGMMQMLMKMFNSGNGNGNLSGGDSGFGGMGMEDMRGAFAA